MTGDRMWSTRLLLYLDRDKVEVLISILIILEIVNFEKFKKGEEEFLNRSLFYYRERKGLIIEFASSNLIKSLTLVLYFQPNRKILRSLPPIFLLFSSMGVVQIRYFGTSHPFPSFFLSPLPLRPRFITYIYIYIVSFELFSSPTTSLSLSLFNSRTRVMQNTRVYLTPWTSGEESSRVQPVPSSFSISSRSLFPYFFPPPPLPAWPLVTRKVRDESKPFARQWLTCLIETDRLAHGWIIALARLKLH